MIRLEGILTELLDFAKPLQMDFTVCNVNHILSSYMELIKMRMKEEGFQVALRLDNRVPEIEADGEKIGQVFMNLLLNAIEASPAGARVLVRSKYHNGGGQEKIEIAVMDEGSGVPEESVDEIFKPFFTTKSKGTGLGLANVKRIIEGHGGWVEVKNRIPKGALFSVFLPVGKNNGQNTHHR
jgi:signal transduction histidine kinase